MTNQPHVISQMHTPTHNLHFRMLSMRSLASSLTPGPSHKPKNKPTDAENQLNISTSTPHLRQGLDFQLLLCIRAVIQGFCHPVRRQQLRIWICHPVCFKQAAPVNAAQLEFWAREFGICLLILPVHLCYR
jgi:hypothetical protein